MIHKAKKSLGQNFLKSEAALKMMCEAGSVSNTDTILEIGPGKGALTIKLLEVARKVIAVEKDHDLILLLKEKFKTEIKENKLELIEEDILLFDPKKYKLKNASYKVIANIPYNITGAIFRKFLSAKDKPKTMVMLVQKEVAERIVARDKKESILSISVKAYGSPKYIMKVGKRFFSPVPKIDSAIIAINNISNKNFNTTSNEEYFFTIIKTSFAHKRKILSKNLEEMAPKEKIKNMFEFLKLNPKTRAEDLDFQTWLQIHKYLSTKI